MSKLILTRAFLERLYKKYNDMDYASEDPVFFLHKKRWKKNDAEIVGLIASSLAVGRVQQILKSISLVLEIMKWEPFNFLMNMKERNLSVLYSSFRHRFFDCNHLVAFLLSMKRIVVRYGSLHNAFCSGLEGNDSDIKIALEKFTNHFQPQCGSLIPSPAKGSACKRLLLFLRWMVRKDEIDIGIWDDVKPSSLIIPLDTHLFRLGKKAKIINTTSANINAAEKLTNFFREMNPDDPVKYDFALSHAGMEGLF